MPPRGNLETLLHRRNTAIVAPAVGQNHRWKKKQTERTVRKIWGLPTSLRTKLPAIDGTLPCAFKAGAAGGRMF